MLLNKDAANLLGLATRARKVQTGSSVIDAVRKNTAKLILICSDASAGTIKQITDKCQYYNVEYIMIEDSEKLSSAMGKQNRKVCVILDVGFAKKIKEKLGVGEENGKTK